MEEQKQILEHYQGAINMIDTLDPTAKEGSLLTSEARNALVEAGEKAALDPGSARSVAEILAKVIQEHGRNKKMSSYIEKNGINQEIKELKQVQKYASKLVENVQKHKTGNDLLPKTLTVYAGSAITLKKVINTHGMPDNRGLAKQLCSKDKSVKKNRKKLG